MQKSSAWHPLNAQCYFLYREESRDWARASESKEHDWLKHIRKYHNYYHSHRKSAEKVTWQITQIGNSAGCLSWQWPVREKKDEGKVILA